MKRFFDLLISLIAFILLLPVMVIVALVIRLTSKGPALHWSKRVGKNNEIFLMPKYRSMYIDTPQVATHLLEGSNSHITPIGKFIRKTSLDEIPQLWSIIKGDMSFVGPRPALFNQYDLIEMRTNKKVHTLVPGLTGWAQINGRDDISLDLKVLFDEEYMKRRSVLFDIYIIYMTFIKVLFGKNISH